MDLWFISVWITSRPCAHHSFSALFFRAQFYRTCCSSSILFLYLLIHTLDRRGLLEPILADKGREAGYTLDRTPAFHIALWLTLKDIQTTGCRISLSLPHAFYCLCPVFKALFWETLQGPISTSWFSIPGVFGFRTLVKTLMNSDSGLHSCIEI